jgi:hypothetical protein
MDSMGKTRRREEKEHWQGFGRDAARPNEDQALFNVQSTDIECHWEKSNYEEQAARTSDHISVSGVLVAFGSCVYRWTSRA